MPVLPRNVKDRAIRIFLALLVINAAVSAAVLAWRFYLYGEVANSPLIHLFLGFLPTAAVTAWVIFTGSFALYGSLVSMTVGKNRRSLLCIAFGHATVLFPYVMAILSFLNIGGPFADRGVHMRLIPGTEHASSGNPSSGFALSVSPDERWVSYWEHYTTWKSKGTDTKWQLCSIDLANQRRTVHRVDSLRREEPPRRVWDDVGYGFDPGGWSGGRLYLDHYDGTMAVDPAREQIAPARRLPPDRSGPDAPSWDVIRRALRHRGKRTENFEMEVHSFAWSGEGQPRNLYSRERVEEGVAAIVREDGVASREVLRKKARLTLYTVRQVRISPDQTFLAYAMFAQGKAHLMIRDYGVSVFVRHLPSGKEKRVGRHFDVSNLIWSSDSERLYHAGSGFEKSLSISSFERRGAGVYCVDVEATFPPREFTRVSPGPSKHRLSSGQIPMSEIKTGNN